MTDSSAIVERLVAARSPFAGFGRRCADWRACARAGWRDPEFRKQTAYVLAPDRYFRESEPKFGKAVEARALDMYLNNVGIRKIARFTGASPAGVLKWIRKAHKALSAQLAQAAQTVEAGMPDVIEMDEIYTFVQKNDAGRSYGLLIAGDSVALLRIISATTASPAP